MDKFVIIYHTQCITIIIKLKLFLVLLKANFNNKVQRYFYKHDFNNFKMKVNNLDVLFILKIKFYL